MTHDGESDKKLNSKDLVFFSRGTREQIAKNDYNFLAGEYEHLRDFPDYENDPKYRVWGLPFVPIFSPTSLGILGGFISGQAINYLRKRPRFSSLHLHVISGLAIGLTAHYTVKFLDNRRIQKELIIWDYVKQHPEDFPEVYNPSKKYKDVLKQWYPIR